ncbi:MAG: hypothetical protein IPK85_21295 [Gemmatimonadetes bacterium]|nr:hypothetical protein [Gemmatimonadota bacterium]
MSVRTIWKWVHRVRTTATTRDRSSRPHRLARQLPRRRRRQILCARHKRWSSLHIAQHYRLAVPTVVSFLRRHGLNRLARLSRHGRSGLHPISGPVSRLGRESGG